MTFNCACFPACFFPSLLLFICFSLSYLFLYIRAGRVRVFFSVLAISMSLSRFSFHPPFLSLSPRSIPFSFPHPGHSISFFPLSFSFPLSSDGPEDFPSNSPSTPFAPLYYIHLPTSIRIPVACYIMAYQLFCQFPVRTPDEWDFFLRFFYQFVRALLKLSGRPSRFRRRTITHQPTVI